MAKKIIREMIIMLLLCLAVILLLGVVLYTYVPGNKTMPEKVSYTVPSDIKKELETNSLTENSQVILTYEINSNDLTNYQKSDRYKAGKPNPFSEYATEQNTEDNGQTNNNGETTGNTTTSTSANTTNTNSGTTTNSSTSSNTNTTNTSPYVNDKGTK